MKFTELHSFKNISLKYKQQFQKQNLFYIAARNEKSTIRNPCKKIQNSKMKNNSEKNPNPNNFEEENNSNTIIYHCKMKFFKIIINIEDHRNTYL